MGYEYDRILDSFGADIDRQRIPPPELRAPLASAIEIRPSPASSVFIVVESDEIHAPPARVAKLSTYDITLELRCRPNSTTEREEIAQTLNRAMRFAEQSEPFVRFVSGNDYTEEVNQRHDVTIDWNKQPPMVAVQGNFTLDMLKSLYELGVLETNLQVAESLRQAALTERRSALFGTTESKAYFRPVESTSVYSRDDVNTSMTDSIGDLAGVEPNERYGKFLRDTRAAFARGMLDEKAVGDTVMRMAALTLDGELPSPYPTARYLLAHGEAHINDETAVVQRMPELYAERVQQVMQDLVGPDQHFVIPKEGVIDTHAVGQPSPVTFDALREQLRQEALTKQRLGMRDYWLGTPQEWRRKFSASSIGADVDHAGLFSVSEIDLATTEQAKREKTAEPQTALIPYASLVPVNDGADLTYFGVTHPVTHDLNDAPEFMQELQQHDYRSRNPDLGEAPRPLPPALQRVLDQHEQPPPPRNIESKAR